MGQVIAKSDAKGGAPSTDKYGPDNLIASIYQTLFDTNEARVAADLPTNIGKIIGEGKPIRELHG